MTAVKPCACVGNNGCSSCCWVRFHLGLSARRTGAALSISQVHGLLEVFSVPCETPKPGPGKWVRAIGGHAAAGNSAAAPSTIRGAGRVSLELRWVLHDTAVRCYLHRHGRLSSVAKGGAISGDGWHRQREIGREMVPQPPVVGEPEGTVLFERKMKREEPAGFVPTRVPCWRS